MRPFAYPGRVMGWLHDLLIPSNAVLPRVLDFREDLNNSLTQVLRVDTEGVAVGEEWGDEGPIVIIDLGSGHLLWLCGQWMFDRAIVDEVIWGGIESSLATRWPRRFSIARAPLSGLVFRIRSSDDVVVSASELVSNDTLYYFGDSRILEGGLPDIRASLAAEFRRATGHARLDTKVTVIRPWRVGSAGSCSK
ncbi:MAG TPA: hypothetical protein PLF11_14760 [Bacillota bacterium]|nr:hypothetical protein [Bacillota bacterium]